MQTEAKSGAKALGATSTTASRLLQTTKELLTTSEVAQLTGFSESYFEKGRIYGYGPKFIRIETFGKTSKILYRRQAVEEWLLSQECYPGGAADE